MIKTQKIFAGLAVLAMLTAPVAAFADTASIDDEISALKTRIAQLEKAAATEQAPAASVSDGLTISGGATLIVQTAQSNTAPTVGEDSTDGTYSVDIGITKSVGDKGEIFVCLEAGKGEGLDGEVATFAGVNGDAMGEDEEVKVTEVGYSHLFADDKLALTFGIIDPSNALDANNFAGDECSQFLNPVFINNPAVEFTEDNAMGILLTAELCETFTLDAGIYENDGDGEDVVDNSLIFAQGTLTTNICGKEGNYRLFVWANQDNHQKLSDPSMSSEDNTGVGISFDQMVTDNAGLFLRYAMQDDEIATLESAWSLGANLNGAMWGCDSDEIGIAFGQNNPSDEYKKLGNPAADESVMEIYYKWQINDNVALSPDLQVVWDPNGVDTEDAGTNDTIVIAGIRAQLDF